MIYQKAFLEGLVLYVNVYFKVLIHFERFDKSKWLSIWLGLCLRRNIKVWMHLSDGNSAMFYSHCQGQG